MPIFKIADYLGGFLDSLGRILQTIATLEGNHTHKMAEQTVHKLENYVQVFV